jgi:uncharacterized hydrophobic protein (TIGR00271 family)
MTSQLSETLAVLLVQDVPVALQMHWAARLAMARRLDMLVLHRVESREDRIVDVSLTEPPSREATGVIHEVQQFIEAYPELRIGPRADDNKEHIEQAEVPHSVQVRMKLVCFTNLASCRRALLDELEHDDIVLFTEARESISDMSDVDLVRERRLFLRYIPCEFVFCLGFHSDNPLERVLVATQHGSDGRAALHVGADLASAVGGTITALHVNPNVGQDAKSVGERRLAGLLSRTLGIEYPGVDRRVVVHDQVAQGIRTVWAEGNHDVVVLGASASRLESSLASKLGKGMPVIMVSTVSPVANRFLEFVEEGVQRVVPQIPREERISLVDRVQSSAAWNFDFLALMVLSTTMAAIGLIQNSAAVVIGAMLVAPLMTPLLGMGLALVQGNRVLARLSFRSILSGLGVALLVGLVVGINTPALEEPTREMLARGGPGLLDLAVAFAAGLAAAYASSRPGLIAALPGVAIAAALVPPIATSGLALSLGDFPLAIGALLLFVINMVIIILASMVSLWLVGIRNLKQGAGWSNLSKGVIVAAAVGLIFLLNLRPQENELAQELPAGLVEAVGESIGTGYDFESLAVAYDELGVQLNVQLVGNAPAPEEMATVVRTLISDHYDQPVRVRLLTRIAVGHTAQE